MSDREREEIERVQRDLRERQRRECGCIGRTETSLIHASGMGTAMIVVHTTPDLPSPWGRHGYVNWMN